jgi:hypothetical protein
MKIYVSLTQTVPEQIEGEMRSGVDCYLRRREEVFPASVSFYSFYSSFK